MTIYTLTTIKKDDCNCTFEQFNHGAYKSYEKAKMTFQGLVEKFKERHAKDIEIYGDKEIFIDEESGGLYMEEDDEFGYFYCSYGVDDEFRSYTISIEEFELFE